MCDPQPTDLRAGAAPGPAARTVQPLQERANKQRGNPPPKEIKVPLEAWQRLRAKHAELQRLERWIRAQPRAVRDAIGYMYILEAAAQEGIDLPPAFQYKGLGLVQCPSCGRTESGLFRELSSKRRG